MQHLENFDLIRVFNITAVENNLKKALYKFSDKLGIVIKSNAYGFGFERILPLFSSYRIKNYFCQDIIEALKAKRILGKDKNVYTFSGVQSGQAKTFIDNEIIPVCVNLEQLKYYNDVSAKCKKKPKTAIHFDTGMNRTGLSEEEVIKLSENWETYTGNLDIVLYVSHLHSSYDKKDRANTIQIKRFKNFTAKLPKRPRSLSATGGSFRLSSEYHFDIVRVGYGVYGMLREMESVISVYAKILQIREVKKGEKIGYFGGWTAKKDMKIAIINIGYKDGYSRSLSKSNKLYDKIRAKLHSGTNFATSYMTIDKYKCPVVGIISMNNTMIDVSNVPTEVLSKHNFVEVIGTNANIMDFREANGFIPCDLLCSLTTPNPNALDVPESEFQKLKTQLRI
ncbi:hypothetical protein HDR60_04000 [bacterium]|nr:hypothetical protein [bacterium]